MFCEAHLHGHCPSGGDVKLAGLLDVMQLKHWREHALEHADVEHVALHVAVLGDGIQEGHHIIIPEPQTTRAENISKMDVALRHTEAGGKRCAVAGV